MEEKTKPGNPGRPDGRPEDGKKGKTVKTAKYLLVIAAAAIIVFNQAGFSALKADAAAVALTGKITGKAGGKAEGTASNSRPVFSYVSTGDPVQDAIDAVFFTGMPEWSDGSVTYDNIEKSLSILANIDRAIPTESLSPELKARYINIGTKISCEYCCGARAVIFPDGRPACGCSHSYALRGVAKYLLTQYGDSYSDEEILFEMTKWKNLFFPKNTVQKAAALIANGMEITTAALNDRGLLQKIEAGDLSSIGMPGMVGGC